MSGALDAVPVADVTRFEAALLSHMRGHEGAVLGTIRDSKDLSDDTRAKLKTAVDGFAKTFA